MKARTAQRAEQLLKIFSNENKNEDISLDEFIAISKKDKEFWSIVKLTPEKVWNRFIEFSYKEKVPLEEQQLDFDWDCLPKWCNDWIAMDPYGGGWYSYDKKPSKGVCVWLNEGELCSIGKDYAPKNYTGSWENSLTKNPNK
jgi:hypothetical protein